MIAPAPPPLACLVLGSKPPMVTRAHLHRLVATGLVVAAVAIAPLASPQLAPRASATSTLPAGIAEPFVASWQSMNGAEVLGVPVSPPVQVDGHLMQFFVYGALVIDARNGAV